MAVHPNQWYIATGQATGLSVDQNELVSQCQSFYLLESTQSVVTRNYFELRRQFKLTFANSCDLIRRNY